MFVGCGCHCRPEAPSQQSVSSQIVSGSVQSFGSSIADDPGRYPAVPCQACRDGVAPAVYEFDWNYQGQLSDDPEMPRPCCPIYSGVTKYRIYASATPCTWLSLEKTGISYRSWNSVTGAVGNTWLCNTTHRTALLGSQPQRVRFQLVQTGQSGSNFVGRLTVAHARGFYDATADILDGVRSSVHFAIYDVVDGFGNVLALPQNQFACLGVFNLKLLMSISELTLDVGPAWRGIGIDGQGVPYGSPCKQVRFSGFDMGLPETATLTPVPA